MMMVGNQDVSLTHLKACEVDYCGVGTLYAHGKGFGNHLYVLCWVGGTKR